MDRFYVYLFLRTDGTPYYVGKGTGNRQWWRRRSRYAQLPTDPARNIRVLDGMSEEDAFAWEKLLIARWGLKCFGTGILHNQTYGGEGASGHIVTEKQSAAIRKANAERPMTPARLEQLSRNRRGRTFGPMSDYQKQRIGEGNKGKVRSQEVRERIAEKLRGRELADDHRAALSRAGAGRPKAAEHKANIQAALIARSPFPARLGITVEQWVGMGTVGRQQASRKWHGAQRRRANKKAADCSAA